MTYLQARSEKEKNRRKKVIVSAAKQLFYDKGYGVSVDEIAAKAKLSKATLYLYYKNKDELYVAAMMEGFQGMEDALTNARQSGGSIEDRLKAVYYAFIDYMLENRKFFRITQHYLAEDFDARISAGVADVVRGEILRHVDYVRELVKEGVNCGLLRQDLDVNAFTTIFWRTGTGLLDLAVADESSDRGTGRWKEIFEKSYSIFMDGTRARKGKTSAASGSKPKASKKK